MVRRKTIAGLMLRRFFRAPSYTIRSQSRERKTLLQQILKRVGPQRSVYIRHLDCGSCNGCELELIALENPVYDMHSYGLEFRASPRHADVIVLTGPFTRELSEAACLTVQAMPQRRIITVGDCTQGGGIYRGSYALAEPPTSIQNAIIGHVPGCPPTPEAILDALTQQEMKQIPAASSATDEKWRLRRSR